MNYVVVSIQNLNETDKLFKDTIVITIIIGIRALFEPLPSLEDSVRLLYSVMN
jgi:hypothetical protein